MKKKIILIGGILFTVVIGVNAQINASSNNVGTSTTSGSAIGTNNTATGTRSLAQGFYSNATGAYSLALGTRNISSNSHAVTIGIDLQSTANRSVTIGSGLTTGTGTDLVNNIASSLMVGFNSTIPTFFVGGASGAGTIGKVGIGTSTPTSTLDVNGDSYFTGNMGIGSAPNAAHKVGISTDNSRGLFVFSSDWSSGLGAEIWGGSKGLLGVAGAYRTTGTQPTETYGVWGIGAVGSSLSCGVHGDGIDGGQYTFGVWGEAIAGSSVSYGVLGEAYGSIAYAGYFEGNVYTTAMYQSSDQKLKKDIKPLKNTDKLMMLQPKEYTYRTDEFESMNLEEGTQMGFIAQDIEEIFPELIKETVQPPTIDKDGKIIKEGITFKAVNYVALIPLLTATIQEQNSVIEEQKSIVKQQENSIYDLMKRVSQLENKTTTSFENDEVQVKTELFQNTPNPFNEETIIKYSLPSSTNQASIMIFDLNGTHKLTIEANVLEGQISVNAKDLSPGIYIYSLIADRTEVASKRMIITK